MGTHQIYRGDPTQKQYYVTSNFNGGINTLDVDENMRDNEFRDLVNVDIATQGIIQSRRGFKELTLLNELMGDSVYPLITYDEPVSFIKILQNDNNIMQKLTGDTPIKNLFNGVYNSSLTGLWYITTVQLEPNKIYNFSFDLKYSKATRVDLYGKSYYNVKPYGTTTLQRYTRAFETDETGILEIHVGYDGGDPNVWMVNSQIELGSYFTNYQTYFLNNTLKILIFQKNALSLYKLENGVVSKRTILLFPDVFHYKKSLINDNCVLTTDKIYISLSDISDKYKGLLIYDIDSETCEVINGEYKNIAGNWISYAGLGDLDEDPSDGLETLPINTGYKPTPYDITSSVSGIAQGFNVLNKSPLLYIDDQKTGLPTIRNIILTDISDGSYLDKIPTDGDFVLNVIKTGNLIPENYQIIFKNEKGEELDYKIGELIESVWSYGTDLGGYFRYVITNLNCSTASYVLINVQKTNMVLNSEILPVSPSYTNPISLGEVLTSGYYCTKDDNKIYYFSGNSNSLSDLTSNYEIAFSYFTTDVSSIEPSDVGIFDYLMTEANDGLYFQLKEEDYYRLFVFVYDSVTPSNSYFDELTGVAGLSDGVLYDTKYHFIPRNGSFIRNNAVSSSKYYLYYNLPNNDYLEIDNLTVDISQTVPAIEGQYYEIGVALEEEPIAGLDLLNIKLLTIDNKLVLYKGNTIYFSKIYQFDYVPNFAFVILPLLSTDEIVNIKYFKGSWIIFTKNTIWKMRGTYGDADWEIQLLNDSIGCIAPNSIVSLENSLYFLSQNGLYRLVQNYYQDGLENVAKADKLIPNLITLNDKVHGVLYRDQYILYSPNEYDNDGEEFSYDALRMYYNIDLADKQKPFVKDVFKIKPNNLFFDSGYIFGLKDSKFYVYDEGYTDFMPSDALSDTDYVYNVIIESSALNFGYPTHDKKIKSIYVKTKATSPTYLYFTIWLDGYLRAEPTSFRAVLDDDEQIVYEEYIDYTKDSNIKLNLDELGELELGNGVLGDNENSTHKITLGYKGKTVQLKIEQQSDGNFGITNIGYLYKLGKVKEQR